MHPSDPDTTHAAAPGAIFVRDGGAQCPDPGDTLTYVPLASPHDLHAGQTLLIRRIEPPAPDPPPPQSLPEAAAHCLHLLESLLDDSGAELAWAAVEAFVAAFRSEAAKTVMMFEPVYHSGDEIARECEPMAVCDEQATLEGAAEAVLALPLEAPR